ncbi:MAG: hypothetical protein Q9218_002882 [Villophora microphyllina]
MSAASLHQEPLHLHVSDPPYKNFFYADHTVACQVVLASPLPRTDSGPDAQHRLLFAWPAGNSGAAVFFKSADPDSGPLSLEMVAEPDRRILDPVKNDSIDSPRSMNPSLGVSGHLSFSESATLTLAILGSIRTIRDYTEGQGILNARVQKTIDIGVLRHEDGVRISRTWFDKQTSVQLTFVAVTGAIEVNKRNTGTLVKFASGLYSFQAHLNYPQAPCMLPPQLLKPSCHDLISQQPDAVKSLSFLCQPDKILAGAWRFFTYFGRDSMLSLLLLNPILSEGEGGAMEAGLSAVLERINYEDGSVCHEENLGDYPAAQSALSGTGSPEAEYDYKMVDTDFFLPILMKQYFIEDKLVRSRLEPFLRTTATLIPSNKGRTYGQLLDRTCRKIMDSAKPFSQSGESATYRNLIPLKEGQPVGQWRDSNDGLGGGRYPYDVNTALMPAALRAIADLARAGAVGKDEEWGSSANKCAEVWEASTLDFFTSKISPTEVQHRLKTYAQSGAFPGFCPQDQIHEDLYLQAVALYEDGSPVNVMHTDAGFRLLLLPHLINSSNPKSIAGHLTTLNSVADSILRTFPAGLYTPVGILIANPAYSTDLSHFKEFTTGAYHGTVVWSWNSLVMLTKGLEVQLSAAALAKRDSNDAITMKLAEPDYYIGVINKLKCAYSRMWETIEANRKHLSEEVWSWQWDENAEGQKEGERGNFVYVPLSHLPTPDGAGQTESNAVQLWSLTFLALERKRELEV